MSNKFLSTNTTVELSKTDVVSSSLAANNLQPSKPVKTDSTRRLVSAELQISDVEGLQDALLSVISLPYEGTLEATNFQTGQTNLNALAVSTANNTSNLVSLYTTTQNLSATPGVSVFAGEVQVDNLISSGLDLNQFAATVGTDVLALKQKTNAIGYNAGTLKTTVSGGLVAANLYTNTIVDQSAAQLINIDLDSVDVLSSQFTYNGQQVATVTDIPTITLSSVGGTYSLVNDGVGPTLGVKGISAGSNITVTDSATGLTINAASAPTTTLTSSGGTYSLVNDGVGPTLGVKGISAGSNITVTDNGVGLTINATDAAATTLTSSGGTYSLVNDGAGPVLTVKGIYPGANITLTDNGTGLTINAASVDLGMLENKTQNFDAVPGSTDVVGTLGIKPFPTSEGKVVLSTYSGTTFSLFDTSRGGKWTVSAQITIIAVGIEAVHWASNTSLIARTFNIWLEGATTTPVAAYIVPRTNLVDGVYKYVLPTPLILPADTYRHAVNVLAGAAGLAPHWVENTTTFVYDPRVSATRSASGNGLGVYPSNTGPFGNEFSTGQLYITSVISEAQLALGSATLLAPNSALLKTTIGGASYGLAGLQHSAGGRLTGSVFSLVYNDGLGFRLFWEPVRSQFQYQLGVVPWYGSSSVIRSYLIESEGKTAIDAVVGTSVVVAGTAYYFSSGTTTGNAAFDLTTPRTVRITLCSADSSLPGSPLIMLTAMRTSTCLIWTLTRNGWDNTIV